MTLEEKINILKSLPLFSKFSNQQINFLAKMLKKKNMKLAN